MASQIKMYSEKSRKYEYGPGKEFSSEESALRHAQYKVQAMREVYTDTGRLISDEIVHSYVDRTHGYFQVEIVFRAPEEK